MPQPRCCSSPTAGEIDGQNVCTNCGAVWTESQIVSEIGFGENSAGAAVVQGSFIGIGETHARNTGPFQRGGGMESRERTFAEARRQIATTANMCNVPESYIEPACRWFTLAHTNNFTHGRRMKHVTASCLYVVCRQEKSSHMLIDFSDVLHLNVFVLGQTYLKLTRILHINIPYIDPSVYIHRFAKHLDFGNDRHTVATDAVRLVARFNRDWITQGRRPSGVCGAAMLLAARMNNYRRSVREIVYIVKVSDLTVQKRLEEFRATASSDLTVEQFRTYWLEQAHDPPSFGPKKGKKRVRKVNDDGEVVGRGRTATPARAGPPATKRRVDKDGFAIPALPTPASTQPAKAASSSKPARRSKTPAGDEEDIPIDPALLGGLIDAEDLLPTPEDDEEEGQTEPENTEEDIHPADKIANTAIANEITDLMNSEVARSAVQEVVKEHIADEVRRARSVSVMSGIGAGDHNDSEAAETRYRAGSLASATAPAAADPENTFSDSLGPNDEELEQEDLSIFDDDWEVAGALLNEQERDIKERIWVANNREYLKKQEEKKLKEARDLRNGIKTRKRRDKNKAAGDGTKKVAASPAESAKELLKGKSFSKKINYQALDYLFSRDEDAGSAKGSSRAPSVDA